MGNVTKWFEMRLNLLNKCLQKTDGLIPLTKTLLSSFVGDRFLVLGLITAHNRNCVLQQTVVGGDGLHCSALPLHTCALPSPVSAPVL